MEDVYAFVLVGFLAQLIDGALGMAYGVMASSILLSLGLPPATISATVHTAECFSTGASAIAHNAFGNIDQKLFKRLLLPGLAGAIAGSYVLASLSGELLKPYIAVYLMVMGLIIIYKAFRKFPPHSVTTKLIPLGFFGALIDAIGGGGWGTIVSTNLIARGHNVRTTIGTVNTAEFFIASASTITFFVTLGMTYPHVIIGLAIGGAVAAPFGALLCKKLPARLLMVIVGLLVVGLALYNIWNIALAPAASPKGG